MSYFVSELYHSRDHDKISSFDTQKGRVAILYLSGKLLVKNAIDQDNQLLMTWIKNPYKVFLHPTEDYVMITSTDGLLHFFSLSDSTLQTTVELASDELRHQSCIGESLCAIISARENSTHTNPHLALLVGTLSMGVCFEVQLEFLSRSIRALCTVLTTLESGKKSPPISGVFYATHANHHTIVLATSTQLHHLSVPENEVSSTSEFFQCVRRKSRKFHTFSAAENPNSAIQDKGSGEFRVFWSSIATGVPRSFCWAHNAGIAHGLFQQSEENFFSRIEFEKTQSFSLAAEPWGSGENSLRSVIPTSSHIVALVGSHCFATQHPAGVAWRCPMPASSTPLGQGLLSSAGFQSLKNTDLSQSEIMEIAYDHTTQRLFLRTVKKVWELSMETNFHDLWELFIQRASNSTEIPTLRNRYFAAAAMAASTNHERNSAFFLHGFFLLSVGSEEDGIEVLSKCEWFNEIFLCLRNIPSLCDAYLDSRLRTLAMLQNSDSTQSSSNPLQQFIFVALFWKCNNPISENSFTDFLEAISTKTPDAFSEELCNDLVNVLLPCGKAESCLALYKKNRKYRVAVSYLIQEKRFIEAAEVMTECDLKDEAQRSVWYDFLPQLISTSPVKLLTYLRKYVGKARKVGVQLDLDPFMPSFLVYKSSDNETSVDTHQVKLLLNASIYKYGNTSAVIHNLYLYLLVEEGDQERVLLHLENSEQLDPYFAMHWCMKYHYTDSMIFLYKKFKSWSNVALLQLEASPPPDKSTLQYSLSHLDKVQLKSVWESVLTHRLNNKGPSAALRVVEESNGVLKLDDLLQFVKDDLEVVGNLKDAICQQLHNYSSRSVSHSALYSKTVEALSESKFQLMEAQKQASYISTTQRCSICKAPLLGNCSRYDPYIVYPVCKHAVHEACAVNKIASIPNLAQKTSPMHSQHSVQAVAAADCVMCGEAAILELGIPLPEI